MGKKKRAFNWKAREEHDTVVDRSAEKKIKLDSDVLGRDDEYDEDNMLVLPSEKRKSKTTKETIQTVRRLSKKERKRLQNVLQQKEKKAKRVAILESLAKVQAKPEEMLHYVGVAAMQSGHLKRETETKQKKLAADSKMNFVAGSNKKTKYSQGGDNCDVEGDDSDASESSIDTSDMSTDEEQDAEVDTNVSDIKNETKTDESEKSKTEEKEKNDKEKSEESTTEKKDEEKEDKEKSKPVVNILVNRDKDIQEARLKLPILAEEQMVMEAINDNPVTIICGETGSGKTTQVPQFLYEAGYAHGDGIIGVTEPRRVAAISMSHRISKEMNLTSSEVSYQIRYEGNVTPKTKIKFMTDGVLLKEVQKDFLLMKYSVVIIDEAHERSVYTDILIGLLSRIVPLRHKKGSPLKLIIMSATLRVEDFTDNTRLFRVTPPVVKVESRQFPVTIHFNKRTPLDNTYLNEAYKKVCKVHRKLPEGGILVFVTGQQEVNTLCRKLRQTFPAMQGGKKEEDIPGKRKSKRTESPEKKNLPKISLDNYSVEPTDEEEEREGGSDSEAEFEEGSDGSDEDNVQEEDGGCSDPIYVLPLYSMLSSDRQAKVFAPPPSGYRLCVVATNVAETSLTIPNIKYVVDTGKVKTKFYDKVTGVSTFRITWTSSASANQRAGRAGRTGPGHCYRLYSSAVFTHDFEKFAPAEITRRPVDDLVLQMKDMNIDKVMNFPYPTQPDGEQIKAAERLLVSLGALTAPVSRPKSQYKGKGKEEPSRITSLGRAMAHFPVSPRYSKMLSLGHQHDLLPYVVVMVAALSVAEVFVELHQPPDESGEKDEFKKRIHHFKQIQKMWAGTGHSLLLGDLTVLLKAVGSCEYQGCTPEFCQKHGIRLKAMREVRKLRVQLTNSVNTVIPDANLCVDPKLDPPNDLQSKLLRQIILTGLADHVARKYPDPPPGADDEAKKLKYAYQCGELEEPLFIHPSSVLYRQNPQYLVYQRIEETSRLYMKGLVAVEPEWLPIFCPSHCTFSKPLDDPGPEFDEMKGEVRCHMTGTFSRCTWALPAVEMEYPLTLEKYKWFARFLLEGKVVPGLAKFTTMLLSSPSTMIKTWAKLQPRTEVLLKCLASEGVDSREALVNKWKTQPTYLFDAYSQWIPQANHFELEAAWPPIT